MDSELVEQYSSQVEQGAEALSKALALRAAASAEVERLKVTLAQVKSGRLLAESRLRWTEGVAGAVRQEMVEASRALDGASSVAFATDQALSEAKGVLAEVRRSAETSKSLELLTKQRCERAAAAWRDLDDGVASHARRLAETLDEARSAEEEADVREAEAAALTEAVKEASAATMAAGSRLRAAMNRVAALRRQAKAKAAGAAALAASADESDSEAADAARRASVMESAAVALNAVCERQVALLKHAEARQSGLR